MESVPLDAYLQNAIEDVAQNGFGLSTAETDERVRIIEAELRFVPDGERVQMEWRDVVRHAVPGAKVHDARLVGCHAGSRRVQYPHIERSGFRAVLG